MKKVIISYESCIINVNYLGSKVECSGEKLKIGSFLKYYFDAIDKTVFIKITGVEMP